MDYSVFLSSTFSDFIQERRLLIETIPYIEISVKCAERLGNSGECLDKTIKHWIDKSDMVVLLISAKYGTEPNPKYSWTRREFEYAKAQDKKIFAYIRTIPEDMLHLVDTDSEKKAKLEEFIELVEEYIEIVPRYEYGKAHLLIANVLRDLERCQRKIEKEKRENSYLIGNFE